MQRAKGILASVGLLDTLLLVRTSRTRPLHYQVTRYSDHLLFHPYCLPQNNHGYGSVNTQQILHFSSQANSVVKLFLANKSSEEVENELEKFNPILTHESVIYVLKKLDKNPIKAVDFFKWVTDKNESKLSNTAYSLMLRILGHKDWMKEFWVMVREMTDKGYEIDKETYATLLETFGREKMASEASSLTKFFSKMEERAAMDASVSTIVGILLESDWSEGVKKKLEDLKLSLSDTTVLKVLREVHKHPLRALSFFHWLREHQDYKYTAVTYNAIVRILGQEDSIEQFWSMIKEMKSEGHDMDIDTYVKVLRQFQKRKMVKEAVELYEFMMEGPYKPSFQDCSLLLRMISVSGKPDLDLVFRVVKSYEEAGHSLTKAIYDGIHRSLTSVGRFDEAEKILRSMKNAGFEPDNITYSQLVFGLCKAERLDEACKVLDDMKTLGCVPDVKTWTILIQGHLFVDEVEKALLCFTKMMEKNCAADADLLEVLVNGLCSKNRVDGAYALIVEMVDKVRLKPWQATYKHLIQKLLGEGKLEEALNLLRLMKSHNYPPFPEPFICYIAKSGTVEDARQFLKVLVVKNFPSSSVYLKVFQSFFEEGRDSEAQDLLHKTPHHIRNHNDILNLFGATKLQKVL
ncbi:pentatricopeptide repeat (PPR) superfamily protein [Tasmannia lanceolata]|uniref:pentatricopeptide repeat (PPR) superfamily protein n=1 Tax=Tasmannia lanceolata TaxID=3420 RepID=UPI0040632D21